MLFQLIFQVKCNYRLINSTDALGNVSKVHYPFKQNQKKKIIISENAIKQKIIKIYDSLGREIKIENKSSTSCFIKDNNNQNNINIEWDC